MLTARLSAQRASAALSAACLIVLGGSGCRIQAAAPYWLETHGHALGTRVAGWSSGALLLGGDRQLWAYPGPWSNPWAPKPQTHELRSITASSGTAYALFSDGGVARFGSNRWTPYDGSQSWGASEIGVSDDDHLFVIANGKLRVLERNQLKLLSCEAITSVAVAGAHGDEAFVLGQNGALYYNNTSSCDEIPAPARLRRIATRAGRLVAVAVDGSLWRRRGDAWSKLPQPMKYRPGHAASPVLAQDVGLSAYSTWLVDTEGSVFMLSDET